MEWDSSSGEVVIGWWYNNVSCCSQSRASYSMVMICLFTLFLSNELCILFSSMATVTPNESSQSISGSLLVSWIISNMCLSKMNFCPLEWYLFLVLGRFFGGGETEAFSVCGGDSSLSGSWHSASLSLLSFSKWLSCNVDYLYIFL